MILLGAVTFDEYQKMSRLSKKSLKNQPAKAIKA
jgi:hypothetical protein